MVLFGVTSHNKAMSTGGSSVCAADSQTATPTRRERLSAHIQKSLAELLESNGGIKSFRGSEQKLSNLLDRKAQDEGRNAIFGKRGDKIRRQLQLKVVKWRQKAEQGTYEADILSLYRVQAWRHRKKSDTIPSPQARNIRGQRRQAVDPSPSSSSSSSSSSSEDSNPRVSNPPLPQRIAVEPPAKSNRGKNNPSDNIKMASDDHKRGARVNTGDKSVNAPLMSRANRKFVALHLLYC